MYRRLLISKLDKAWLKECCTIVANGTVFLPTLLFNSAGYNLKVIKFKYKVIDVAMIVQSYHFSHFLNLVITRLLLGGGNDTIFSTSQLSSC